MKKVFISKQNMEKSYSGASRNVYEQIKFFKEKNYEIHVVAENNDKKTIKEAGAIPHTTFKFPWQKKIRARQQYSKESLKIIRKENPDILIGHGDIQEQDVLALHNSVHLAYEKIHGVEIPHDHQMAIVHGNILKERKFKDIIANSELMKKDLIERFDIPEESITVIYPSFKAEQFVCHNDQKKLTLRESMGVRADENLVGLITSGNYKKRGVDRFFQAISLLPKEIAEKSHFIFVGKDKLSKEYKDLLEKSPYRDRIKNLPVVENVQDYFNMLDVFVLPARIEEFGRVVAESMSCGCPVITTKWVGASELFEKESRQFIYDGDNNQELADLISKLLTEKDLAKKVGDINRISAQKVSESKTFEKFDDFFEKY